MAFRALALVRVSVLARPVFTTARHQSTTITVSPSDVDDFNLEPHTAEMIKALFPANASQALRLARKLAMEREQAKLAMEWEQQKAKLAMEEKARLIQEKAEQARRMDAVIDHGTKVLANAAKAEAFAHKQLLKKTTEVPARYIQETLERSLGVRKTSRQADWEKLLRQEEHYDLVHAIVTKCLKHPQAPFSATWKPNEKHITEVAQQIQRSYGNLSSGIYYTVHKNLMGHLEIDTKNTEMCVAYQLGLKLSRLDPEIVVVAASTETDVEDIPVPTTSL